MIASFLSVGKRQTPSWSYGGRKVLYTTKKWAHTNPGGGVHSVIISFSFSFIYCNMWFLYELLVPLHKIWLLGCVLIKAEVFEQQEADWCYWCASVPLSCLKVPWKSLLDTHEMRRGSKCWSLIHSKCCPWPFAIFESTLERRFSNI